MRFLTVAFALTALLVSADSGSKKKGKSSRMSKGGSGAFLVLCIHRAIMLAQ